MLYKYGTTLEVLRTAHRFPDEVFTQLLESTSLLDAEYGADRDYTLLGGYSLVAEELNDLSALREIVNIDLHPCEWATRLGTSGFVSALYVVNNDYTLMICLPERIAPPSITDEL